MFFQDLFSMKLNQGRFVQVVLDQIAGTYG